MHSSCKCVSYLSCCLLSPLNSVTMSILLDYFCINCRLILTSQLAGCPLCPDHLLFLGTKSQIIGQPMLKYTKGFQAKRKSPGGLFCKLLKSIVLQLVYTWDLGVLGHHHGSRCLSYNAAARGGLHVPRCKLACLVICSLWVRSSTLLFEGGIAHEILLQREIRFKLCSLFQPP